MGRREGRSRNRAELAVATLDGSVVGFILYHLHGTFHYSGYVRWIAVATQARGRGGGTALMRHAEAHIFRTGPNVFLTVSDFNPPAQAFHPTLRHRHVGALPHQLMPGTTHPPH